MGSDDADMNDRLFELKEALDEDPANQQALREVFNRFTHESALIRANSVAIYGQAILHKPRLVSDEVIQTLRDLIKDEHQSVRSAAARTLGYTGKADPENIALLADLALRANARDSWLAIEALGNIGGPRDIVVPKLIDLLQLEYVKDGDYSQRTRISAINALAEIGVDANAAIPALRKLLDHSNVSVAKAARGALSAISEAEKPN